MTFLKQTALIVLTAILLTACNGGGSSNSPDVKARQDLMQDWRSASDIMKGMMENPASFDPATFKEQAYFIHESNQKMWTHFADANAKGKGQDAIWTDAAGFKAKQDEFVTATTNLILAADSAKTAADVEQAFGKMTESCGGCHKAYKK